jgi:hypothetical protein
MSSKRRPVIGVMGGGEVDARVAGVARTLGRLIAERGWVLLNGGRDAGVMAASAAGAHEADPPGLVIGILPGATAADAAEDVDVAVVTGMGDARNVINVLSSDVVIACPGGPGTVSEIALALKSGKRVILLDWELRDPPFAPFLQSGQLTLAKTPQEAVSQAAAALP